MQLPIFTCFQGGTRRKMKRQSNKKQSTSKIWRQQKQQQKGGETFCNNGLDSGGNDASSKEQFICLRLCIT